MNSIFERETNIKQKLTSIKSLFFVGIGGVSMSSLAAISKSRGYDVKGSDRSRSDTTKNLEKLGIKIFYDHSGDNILGSECLIYTAAVKADNPEIIRAKELGITLMSRAEFLGALMLESPCRIGVAGTHGKTTTTSMISEIFLCTGKDPTIVNGAELKDINGSFRIGSGENFIFEACEYKDSFLSFCPTTAVVTNVELDHVDYFKNIDQMRTSFEKYISEAETAIINYDDKQSLLMLQACGNNVKTVGFSIDNSDADYRAADITYINGRPNFSVIYRGNKLCDVSLKVPGRHNIMNALAAAAASHHLGISGEDIAYGLEKFCGAKRRFEFLGERGGVEYYEDYAHHPSEIRATLSAARDMNKRIICIFQPHTYSRTAALFEDTAKALSMADITVLADIYAARETNTYGVTSEKLAEIIDGARYFDSFEKIADFIKSVSQKGDMVFIMGAGDISGISHMLLG